LLRFDQLLDSQHDGIESSVISDTKRDACLVARGDHLIALGGIESHWLFDENVLASSGSRDRLRAMAVDWSCDVDGIQVG